MGLFDKRDRRKRVSRNEFDSPVEQIDLSAASGPIALPEPQPQTDTARPAPQGAKKSAETPAAQPAAPQAVPAPAAPAPSAPVHALPETPSAPVQAVTAQAATVQAVTVQAATVQAATVQAATAQAATVQAAPETPSAPAEAAPALAYGIDNAIELMRTLPNDNIELVVKVVKHTLESLQIRTTDIIQDAISKQESIEARLKQLRAEIAEYEKQIAERQKEIEKLGGEYKETNTVRKHLELAENLCKNGNGKRTGNAAPRAPSPPAGRAAGPAGHRNLPRGPEKPVTRAGHSPLLDHGPAKK